MYLLLYIAISVLILETSGARKDCEKYMTGIADIIMFVIVVFIAPIVFVYGCFKGLLFHRRDK
mgnify:FL=1